MKDIFKVRLGTRARIRLMLFPKKSPELKESLGGPEPHDCYGVPRHLSHAHMVKRSKVIVVAGTTASA